jgi:hypothetical protein
MSPLLHLLKYLFLLPIYILLNSTLNPTNLAVHAFVLLLNAAIFCPPKNKTRVILTTPKSKNNLLVHPHPLARRNLLAHHSQLALRNLLVHHSQLALRNLLVHLYQIVLQIILQRTKVTSHVAIQNEKSTV